jgi:hypothetical protein
MKIQHVVIVRFSLDYPNSYLNNYSVFEREEWFKRRSLIFEAGTYSSIKRNTILPKEILCVMHISDEENYTNYLSHLDIVPIFSNLANYNDLLHEHLKKRYISALVSRIDSDDLVSRDYFQSINYAYRTNLAKFYVVTRAVVTDFSYANTYVFKVSPFITYFFEISDCRFDLFKNFHHDIYKLNPVLIDNSSWLQIIHANLSNRVFTKCDQIMINVKNIIKKCLNFLFGLKYPIHIENLKVIPHKELNIEIFSNSSDWKKLVAIIMNKN